ncbi:MAG: transglycosylase SLT domain-containing protein [Deltaproteobacteria bacterium]|nr:transglycosylase SLT domain-containing protein [Deltaproteobacteria bacterium]
MPKLLVGSVVLALCGPRCPPSGDEPVSRGAAEGGSTEAEEDATEGANGCGAGGEADDDHDHDDDHAGGEACQGTDGGATPVAGGCADTASSAEGATDAATATPTPVERLRAAVDAFRTERWAEAENGFRGLLGEWQAIDDVLRYWAMEAAWRGGRLDAALPDAELLAAKDGPHLRDAVLRLGDIAYEQQRWADAVARYESLGEDLPRGVDGAVVRFRIARCREEAGDGREARRSYEDLVRHEPDSPAAAEAEARLRAIDPAFTVPPAWRLERARTLVRRRDWAEAIAELDLVPAGTTSPSPEDVAWERANAIYKHRRRYEEAAQAFAVVVEMGGRHAVEAEFLRARSLARANLDDEAIAAYREFAQKHPRDAHATDAKYLPATLDMYHGRFDRAIEALEALVGRDRSGPGRPQTRWSLGLAYLLADRPADALELIDGTLDDDDDAYGETRATYWGAVARLDLGRTDEATAMLRKVIAASPLHWYALLARHRLAGLGAEVPPPYPERTVGRSDLRERCDELPPEVRALRDAGLLDDARALALPALRPLIAPAEGDELRDVVGRLLCVEAVDLVHDHVRSAAHTDDWGLRLDATALPYWEAAYPKAWRERVEAASARESSSPYLIWAIMRQESSFDPDVVSQADAIGLLQMIPPTTARMLEARGETYDDAVLYDPERNIDLGVEYIARIGEKFHAQMPLQAAGFNGGPHNVARWLDDMAESRLDYFVERIPFEQTRNYVRRVLTSYARYLYLYETDENEWPVDLPMELRRDYLPEPSY